MSLKRANRLYIKGIDRISKETGERRKESNEGGDTCQPCRIKNEPGSEASEVLLKEVGVPICGRGRRKRGGLCQSSHFLGVSSVHA